MRHMIMAAWISMAIFNSSWATDQPDPLAAKKGAWQKVLEREKFRFSEAQATAKYSVSQYSGDCKIDLVSDPKRVGNLTLNFKRDGKEVLVLPGHLLSVFRAVDNVLFFADFEYSSAGCKVVAYDLTTEKKLWETRLNAAECYTHSAYMNQVTLDLSSLEGQGDKTDRVIYIRGHESYGDYAEILDPATGKILARKIYRQGYNYPKK